MDFVGTPWKGSGRGCLFRIMIKQAFWASHGAKGALFRSGGPAGLQLCDLEGAPVPCGGHPSTKPRVKWNLNEQLCKCCLVAVVL